MPDLRIVKDEDKLVSLAELKRLKNQGRRQRKKLTFAKLKAGQPKEVHNRSPEQDRQNTCWQKTVCKWCGIALTIAGLIIVARNAYGQGDNSIDKWIAVGRDMTCEAVIFVMLSVATISWRQK